MYEYIYTSKNYVYHSKYTHTNIYMNTYNYEYLNICKNMYEYIYLIYIYAHIYMCANFAGWAGLQKKTAILDCPLNYYHDDLALDAWMS